jgi:ribose transport system ATP-binding protein
MQGVVKRFGPLRALDGVDLEVAPGEVHALLGENGAGKSTLMKVLSGAHAPDAGAMTLDGAPYTPRSPQEARRRGVAMIYQELSLAAHLTVEENVLLGSEVARFGWIDRRARRRLVTAALQRLGPGAPAPDARVAELTPGARQLVEIARALALGARLIVFDEPTSSLSAADSEALFEVVRSLSGDGVSVIWISHFLEEVARVATRFTVLRDGRTVGSGLVANTPASQLVALMAGRALEQLFPRVPHQPGEVVLSVDHLAGHRLPIDASFELRRGELFGIAGLIGAGRTELLRVLFGLDAVRSGKVRVAGFDDHADADPGRRLSQGLGLLGEDRKGEGLALEHSIAANVVLSRPQSVRANGPAGALGLLSRAAMGAATKRLGERLQLKCAGPFQPVGQLSGGNQQKVALARLLHHDVDVLLCDEPTRGIDVGAKVEVYRLLGELAAAGKAVVVVSSYLPELLGICDRIAVMHRGRLGSARPVDQWTEHGLLEACIRGEAAPRG